MDDGVSALSSVEATKYRRGVGKIMWLTPIRGDIYYMAKELAIDLQNPTNEGMAKLRHLLRYLKGTSHYAQVIASRIQLHGDAPAELHVYVDSDWAGCTTTRKSTSGCVVSLLGCTIHSFNRTQGPIPLPLAAAKHNYLRLDLGCRKH